MNIVISLLSEKSGKHVKEWKERLYLSSNIAPHK